MPLTTSAAATREATAAAVAVAARFGLTAGEPEIMADGANIIVHLHPAPVVAKVAAIEDVSSALLDGALRVGEAAGLPLHRFPLADIRAAHVAVESGLTGKVLVDVSVPGSRR